MHIVELAIFSLDLHLNCEGMGDLNALLLWHKWPDFNLGVINCITLNDVTLALQNVHAWSWLCNAQMLNIELLSSEREPFSQRYIFLVG
jgi:hypothetical protein